MYHKLFYTLSRDYFMNRRSSIFLVAIAIMSITIIGPLKQIVYAHTFSGDESAAFLALVRQIEAEIGLVDTNLSSNITLAQEHAEHATEHLDANTTKELTERNERVSYDLTNGLSDLQSSIQTTPPPDTGIINDKVSNINATLQDAIAVRIEKNQLNNSTVNALAINDILGEVLEHYGAAYGISEEQEEGGQGGGKEGNGNESGSTTITTANTTEAAVADSNASKIIDLAEYQSAQAYANEARQMFDEIKAVAPSNSSSAIADVESGIDEVIVDINNKAPFAAVDEIVDSKVLPSLKAAFNLTQLPLE
jgi:hypothetical protein